MKKLTIVLLALLLPMISLAQSAVVRTVQQTESAKECNKKGDEYYNKKEYKQAVEWYQKGANQGYALAQANLGYMYDKGLGVTKDYAKAVEWYQKAANQGNATAQKNLGLMYENGNGVSKDYAKAVAWYQKAANQGYASAQNNLGWMYRNGYGVTKDYGKAVEWYQKAANQGNANAQFNLGYMYDEGLGVTKDYAKAVEWYQKAANQGHASAQCNLGYMYRNGRGVTKDYAKAIEWYQKAVNQGNATAQNNLGLMYENGNGVTKNYAKAVELYQKAANQGYASAQNNLGLMYENGNGVSKDYTKALELYQKAANQGNEKAKNNLASLQKKMAEEKNALAQTTTTSTQKPVEKSKEQKTVSPKPIPQPTIGIDLVDTDIPVIGRVNKNTFAIIIANEDYQVETKVDYAKNDGEVFKNYCHRTLGLPEKNVHFVANATRNNIIGELYWLSQVCKAYKGEANVIFYYAGHGLPDEDSGSAYLLPVDGNSQLLPTCYSINELYATLGSLPAKKVTVLMDACFSGAKRSGGMLASARGVAIKAKAASPKGSMIVLSAAQGNETAYKYEEAKHGLFTYFLLKKLKDSKGNVTMGELSNYIQDQVGRYSIVENGKSQTPSVMTSDNLRSSWKGLTFY
jgi:TPR repeat protein